MKGIQTLPNLEYRSPSDFIENDLVTNQMKIGLLSLGAGKTLRQKLDGKQF